mgnify:CR=1 FL=1
MLDKYVKRILQSRVYDVAVETPIHAAPLISKRIGNRVLLKREDLQPVFSFKLRGAYNKLCQLTDEHRGAYEKFLQGDLVARVLAGRANELELRTGCIYAASPGGQQAHGQAAAAGGAARRERPKGEQPQHGGDRHPQEADAVEAI